MRSVDQKESFSPLGKAIPAPAPPSPALVGWRSQIYDLGPPAKVESYEPPSLKWVGDAADKFRQKHAERLGFDALMYGTAWAKVTVTDSTVEFESIAPADLSPLNFPPDDAWRGIHAQQAADMAVIREIDMGRKADRD
jgi:hypothetical protein